MSIEIVVQDVPLGEGPVWCPDGTLVITHIAPGGLRRIDPASGRSEVIVSMDGGANSAQLAADGGFVVTQNGGMDFSPFAETLGIDVTKIPYVAGTAGLQRVSPSGEVSYLADAGFNAPNDLIVAADGTIYFTDPPHLSGSGIDSGTTEGRLWSYATDGSLRQVAGGFSYDNGVALSPEGRLLIVEANGLLWVDPDSGETDWFVEKLPGESPGDGFCFDVDGRLYVAAPMDHCIRVLDRDGKQVEVFELGDTALPTNCCLGGSDGRTLFTTELAPGRVCAIEGLPAAGLPLTPWPG
jgi:sugar lactone lactonase YvrE